ncbi:uncharacterized protein LOC108912356 [Anoplophora glabripennis]|uniref:uncharacterized protein LOC108912356 n=1 Tax=Anoplophora glabripennis TaxID=217634 RepID=UPI0008750C12|nr:uncharacterized protein LOC108912356 [Anoplophora glabripennis]
MSNSCPFHKIVFGLAIPVKLGPMQTIGMGWNFQFQYTEPTNITQLQTYPPVVSARSRDKREMQESDRALFYSGLEGVLNSEGIDGRACILRSICENAADSTFHEANGLYGHLIHIALTPDYGDGEVDPQLNPIYYEAQKAGEYGVECDTLYPDCNCRNGFLDLFSVVEEDLQKYTEFK